MQHLTIFILSTARGSQTASLLNIAPVISPLAVANDQIMQMRLAVKVRPPSNSIMQAHLVTPDRKIATIRQFEI